MNTGIENGTNLDALPIIVDGDVRQRLLSPATFVDIKGLSENWFHTDLVWRIKNYGLVANDPSLPGRLRGAFGAVLALSASNRSLSGKPCKWNPPCAFEILFRKQGRMEPGLEFVSPWVMDIDRDGKDLAITLRLFGFASDYVAVAVEAMTQAILSRVDFAGGRKIFLEPVSIIDRSIIVEEIIEITEMTSSALVLDFISPVALSNTSVLQRPQSLITTLVARIGGIARWMDCELEIDRSLLKKNTGEANFSWLDPMRLDWVRGSSQQQKKIRMQGFTGRLVIDIEDGAFDELTTLVSIGAVVHCGADVAFGLGRYIATSSPQGPRELLP